MDREPDLFVRLSGRSNGWHPAVERVRYPRKDGYQSRTGLSSPGHDNRILLEGPLDDVHHGALCLPGELDSGFCCAVSVGEWVLNDGLLPYVSLNLIRNHFDQKEEEEGTRTNAISNSVEDTRL